MPKQIVLLTAHFPWGVGEDFIENEVPYLSGLRFIFSSDDRASIKRSVPNGVYCYSIPKPSAKRLLYIMKILFNTLCKRSFYAELSSLVKSKRLNSTTLGNLVYFIGYSVLEAKYIRKQLHLHGITNESAIVFYSYWLDTQANTACLLRKWFPHSTAISRAHGGDMYEFRSERDYLPMRKYLFENLDAVYPASEDGRKYIEEKYEVQPRILKVKRLGTQDYGFKEKISNSSFRIVTCSNIIPLKRLHLVIEALSKMHDIALEWIHFGDGELRDEIKKLTDLNLEQNIKYSFMGQISNSDLMSWYQNNDCHLFINVSESEGGNPVSIMEALSFGIPIIVSDSGGGGETAKNGKNGILLDKYFESEALVDAITKFYYMAKTSPAEYKAFRKAARDYWSSNYRAEKIYTAFNEEILALKRGGAS